MVCCPKCGSQNYEVTSQTTGKIKKRGCISIIFHLIMICITLGMWIIIPLLRGGSKGKIKSTMMGFCRDCGNKFKV